MYILFDDKQGVIKNASGVVFSVQLFSWLTGERTDIVRIELPHVHDAEFFTDEEVFLARAKQRFAAYGGSNGRD